MSQDGFVNGCLETKFQTITSRSSRPEVFCEKGVLKNFTKFTGKYLCLSLFFNKLKHFFIKKQILAQVFSCEFCEIFKNTFFYRAPPVAAFALPKEFAQSCKLCNYKYMIVSTQKANAETFAFIAVLDFKLLSKTFCLFLSTF